MRIVDALEQAAPSGPACVTIGAFDGLHLGHRHLIGSLVTTARAAGRVATVVTFHPHPGVVLGRRPLASLSTPEERQSLIGEMGVDLLAVLPFTPALASVPAAGFVERLRARLHMVELWVGHDFALGHRREGTVAHLRRMGDEMGFAVQVVDPLVWQGAEISSTRIRRALLAGDLEEANGCLGRAYRLAGSVAHVTDAGEWVVAEVRPLPGLLVPAAGDYGGWVELREERIGPAALHVGDHSKPEGLVVCIELPRSVALAAGRQVRIAFASARLWPGVKSV